jgi:hypothetical protein
MFSNISKDIDPILGSRERYYSPTHTDKNSSGNARGAAFLTKLTSLLIHTEHPLTNTSTKYHGSCHRGKGGNDGFRQI